jgi:AcrR family transcriptional regulator
MARPRKEKARDTRRLILEAALDLFATSGYFGTSMRQISRAVGVRESALYHHFASKEAILAGLLDDLGPGRARELFSIDAEALAKTVGAKKLLYTLMVRIIETWETPQEQKLARLILSEGPRLSREGVFHPMNRMLQAREHLAQIFTALVKLKMIRPVDPQAVTLTFMGPLFMLRMGYLVMSPTPQMQKLRREADAHFNFFWENLKKTNERSPY